jgi:hypothetical protein
MTSGTERIGHADTNHDCYSSVQYQEKKHFPLQLLSGLGANERLQDRDQYQRWSNRPQHSQNQTRG